MDESEPATAEAELIDDSTAAELLEVEPGRIDVMVEEGMLTPAGESPRTFRRADVLALRQSGA